MTLCFVLLSISFFARRDDFWVGNLARRLWGRLQSAAGFSRLLFAACRIVGSGFQPAAGFRAGVAAVLAVLPVATMIGAGPDPRLADAAKKKDRTAVRAL